MSNNINTILELRNYLENTPYDVTILYVSYTDVADNVALRTIVRLIYEKLRLNPLYQLTYEILFINSSEIRQLFLKEVTIKYPYLFSYKKIYRYTRDVWWRPCKTANPNGLIKNLKEFIITTLEVPEI